MTKICDFPYPIYELTKSLMMIAAGTVALNIILLLEKKTYPIQVCVQKNKL